MNATKLLTKYTLILIGLLIALSACTVRSNDVLPPTAAPTQQQPAFTPTLPPTQVPAPTAAPTQAPAPTDVPAPTATQVPPPTQPPPPAPVGIVVFPTPVGDGPCTYRATFVGDMTIPDNSVLSPGAAFVKTWRLRNDGTCVWGSNGHPLRTLVFVNGDRLGAPIGVALPGDVWPGSLVDLSVQMIAPPLPGTYRSEWLLWNDAGYRVGVGANGSTPLYTQIVVAPAPVSGDGNCRYVAKFLGDVTIPDNTLIAPGAAFVKTWRIRNDGTCTWGSNGYALHSLVFVNGNRLSAPDHVALPGVVPPGTTIDLSVNMIAPTTPGSYRSEWQLFTDGSPSGDQLIGFGAYGNLPLYAQIIVASPVPPPPPPPPSYRQTYYSSIYQYAFDYPADWKLEINTNVPTGVGTYPEYVTLYSSSSYLPRIQFEVLTDQAPMTGFENCTRNLVFHNVAVCKISVPAGQNPAAEVWVFQRGSAHFFIQMMYENTSALQTFADIMTSFRFTP